VERVRLCDCLSRKRMRHEPYTADFGQKHFSEWRFNLDVTSGRKVMFIGSSERWVAQRMSD